MYVYIHLHKNTGSYGFLWVNEQCVCVLLLVMRLDKLRYICYEHLCICVFSSIVSKKCVGFAHCHVCERGCACLYAVASACVALYIYIYIYIYTYICTYSYANKYVYIYV